MTAGYDPTLGISSIRSACSISPNPESERPDEVGVEEVAKILGTYPEVVRFLARWDGLNVGTETTLIGSDL